jgi:hypothetical protein
VSEREEIRRKKEEERGESARGSERRGVKYREMMSGGGRGEERHREG